ncbi:MAG: 3-hydroxyacyl-ACP dehydratase FabZ [Simkaniaceae bacterium]|nr:3-hydroxyacyl-ACP dehydratase FabZ [Simkaniaceae bacterium]
MTSQSDTESIVFGTREIASILPHRYPFLLVDRIVELDLEKDKIVGIKCLTMNEAFFQGHFPDAPIMPGVLILEALAQVGGVLVHEKGLRGTVFLLHINSAKFRHPVIPGDVLRLNAQGIRIGARGARIQGQACVGDRMVAEAEIGFVLREKGQVVHA